VILHRIKKYKNKKQDLKAKEFDLKFKWILDLGITSKDTYELTKNYFCLYR
jgi:hypothetical protein